MKRTEVLVNRRKEGAFIRDEDEAIARVIRMVERRKSDSCYGKKTSISRRIRCACTETARKRSCLWRRIRSALKAEGIEIAPLSEICGLKFTGVE